MQGEGQRIQSRPRTLRRYRGEPIGWVKAVLADTPEGMHFYPAFRAPCPVCSAWVHLLSPRTGQPLSYQGNPMTDYAKSQLRAAVYAL